MNLIRGTVVAAALLAIGVPAVAQNHEAAIKARQATMQLYSHFLGQLGAMAKGDVDYDAEKAGVLAASLASVAGIDQSAMWPPGSDNTTLGDMTRALPAIWTTFPAISEKGQAMGAAVEGLQGAAGNGLDALRAAMGPVGGSCSDCHKTFRLSTN